jgi:CelD/BcsL family acetyltransferase involved in cellulose biosynthesis
MVGMAGIRSGDRVDISLFATFEDAERSWRDVEAHGSSFVFQSFDWCSTWFETIGRALQVEPLLAHVREPASGAEMFLPLGVERKRFGIRCLGFLDGRLADHTGPVLAGRTDAAFAPEVVSGVLRELQSAGRCDVADFRHLRATVDGRRNPLFGPGCSRADYATHSVATTGTWEAYAAQRNTATHRAGNRRRWRRLAERGTPRFVIADTVEVALEITEVMLAQKAHRYGETGRVNMLAHPAYREFYLRATRHHHKRGLVHVSALLLDDRVLATHWGAIWNDRLLWLMPSYEGGEWARYSPGRLLLERLLEWSFERGLRAFDCTIGDEPYKATWCNETDHLYRLIRPRSALGWAYYAKARLSAPARRRLVASEDSTARRDESRNA